MGYVVRVYPQWPKGIGSLLGIYATEREANADALEWAMNHFANDLKIQRGAGFLQIYRADSTVGEYAVASVYPEAYYRDSMRYMKHRYYELVAQHEPIDKCEEWKELEYHDQSTR